MEKRRLVGFGDDSQLKGGLDDDVVNKTNLVGHEGYSEKTDHFVVDTTKELAGVAAEVADETALYSLSMFYYGSSDVR